MPHCLRHLSAQSQWQTIIHAKRRRLSLSPVCHAASTAPKQRSLRQLAEAHRPKKVAECLTAPSFANATRQAHSWLCLHVCRPHQPVQHTNSKVPASTRKLHLMHSGSARSCSNWSLGLCMPGVFLTAIQTVYLQVLATAGVASRRGAEDLILQGKVKVNGKIVSSNVPITRQDKVCHPVLQSHSLPDVVPVIAASGVHFMPCSTPFIYKTEQSHSNGCSGTP